MKLCSETSLEKRGLGEQNPFVCVYWEEYKKAKLLFKGNIRKKNRILSKGDEDGEKMLSGWCKGSKRQTSEVRSQPKRERSGRPKNGVTVQQRRSTVDLYVGHRFCLR